MSIAIVVGRFQVPELHTGHQFLFDQVKNFDQLVVFLGVAPKPDKRNPLPFEARKDVLETYFFDAGRTFPLILPLQDRPSLDLIWVHALDSAIFAMFGTADVCMVGGRDSFLDTYRANAGAKPTIRVEEDRNQPHTSGTLMRANIQPNWGSLEFRQGYIAAFQGDL